MTPALTTAAPPESQVLDEGATLTGALLAACAASPGAKLSLTWIPGAPMPARHVAARLCAQASAPDCRWAVGGREGPLSAMSFVALWNGGAEEAAGHPLDLGIDDRDGIDLPFVAWHPSGCLQAIRYDGPTGTFVRSVLYPMASPACRGVMDRQAPPAA